MRRSGLPAVLILGAAFVLFGTAACRERESEGVRTTIYDKAESATRQPGTAEEVLTPPQREQFLDQSQGRLRQAEEALQGLQEDAGELSEAARVEFERRVEQLRRQRAEVREHIQQLREVGAEGWPKVQAETQAALEELEAGIRRLSEGREAAASPGPRAR